MRGWMWPALASLVGVTWSASFVAGIVTHDYTPLAATTTVMLIVTGAVMKSNGGAK